MDCGVWLSSIGTTQAKWIRDHWNLIKTEFSVPMTISRIYAVRLSAPI